MVATQYIAILLGALAAGEGHGEAERFFESRVRPILAQRCYQCHSLKAGKQEGDLALDVRERLLAGGARGTAVVAREPEASLLIAAVRHESEDLAMPPSGKLPAAEIETLVHWVRSGAVVPANAAIQPPEDARSFWSFQAPVEHALPDVRERQWPRQRLDWFVLQQLEAHSLTPRREADPRTLARRLTFDLLGLPPSEDDLAALMAEDASRAYEQFVDRLLASPHYGERWGRHWLDLARYTDATDVWLKSAAQGWLYRDWVVNALNEDRPYDDFSQRQLAADQMPQGEPRDLAALGFLGLSPTYWKELRLAPEVIKVVVADEWEERIDAVTSTFLGLTVACARCHDHKFDPITMQDYYALAGVFANTQLVDRPLLPPAEAAPIVAAHARMEKLNAEIALVKDTDSKRAADLQQQIDAIRRATPHLDEPLAHVVEDASVHVVPDGPDATRVEYHAGEMIDLPVFLRGNPTTLGEMAPRRFLAVLSQPDARPFQQGSGRLELAEALFREGAPLTARVIVNRVWRHHFGHGLVATPSNLGRQGERPTHPELLDDLTARFIANGWSLKWLHREIVLSATYRQSSEFDPQSHQLDPDNNWLWRMNRRRLEVEAWRDACLAASGELDLRMGGPGTDLTDLQNRRRTVYGIIARRELDVVLRQYDFPEAETHSPARLLTTTPLQQLFVLNSPFFELRTQACTESLVAADVDTRIRSLYRRLLQRQPTTTEIALAWEFLGGDLANTERWRQYVHALLGSNEFMFVD